MQKNKTSYLLKCVGETNQERIEEDVSRINLKNCKSINRFEERRRLLEELMLIFRT